ncbi:MAG: FGLLP motif-containing membrane protein, partial [Candidatus Limnocylindrales bacterium]
IFNSTLGDNRALIERYARRKRPRAFRRSAGAQAGILGRIAHQLIAWSQTWTGLVLYLLLAALLYAFLDNTFPFQNAARTFGTTLFGIAVGTAVSQVPGELYVRRRYKTRGKVRVALWTLLLAGACVVITRVTGVQPGYVYGIIGGFTFGIAISADDRGRMAFRGMSILLLVGLAAWFARIPFEPSVGLVSGDTGAVVNQVLADIFIGAVQGTAIGLIPLKFLAGETLFAWNRWKWAVLWGAAILFFAHVVLYPVSSFTPNPSPTGLWTILITVVVYGAIALGFWWFFRQRAIRHEGYRAKAAALVRPAEAEASEEAAPRAGVPEPGPDPAPGG